jgi:hypothetical protein
MDRLRHDVAWAGMYSILEVLPPETFSKDTQASIAFDVYQRLKAMLEAYDVQVGMRQHRLKPSSN